MQDPQPLMIDADGMASPCSHVLSTNQDARPDNTAISLIVIHNISLPPQQYGGEGILQLFGNCLDPQAHPYYAQIAHLKVSSHFVIRRDGALIQCVPCTQRAWHAGVSSWQGRERCNDFSIGIELEGSDFDAFEEAQYVTLKQLIAALTARYPITGIAGHEHIAPGRKTDPGPFFEWSRVPDIAADD